MTTPRHTEPDEALDQLLPIGTAAQALGVSVDTVRRWERTGKISAVRTIGGQRRFRQSDIDALLDGVA